MVAEYGQKYETVEYMRFSLKTSQCACFSPLTPAAAAVTSRSASLEKFRFPHVSRRVQLGFCDQNTITRQ
jgi:hypothetical protein